jgi:Ni,Fe-hydrogenase III component G
MDIELIFLKAETLLASFTVSCNRPEANRLDIVIKPADIIPAVKALLVDGHWGYLSAITGLDHPETREDEVTKEKIVIPEKGNLELLYHFALGAAITTLRTEIPYDDPRIDSICGVISSAQLYEREAAELLGVDFIGAPNTDHLVLPDDWPAGVYPLRKSFTGLEKKA